MKYPFGAAFIALAIASGAQASSHREAPFISKTPQVDATDFYMFMSYEPGREDFVTLVSNYIPVQAAYGGPNYFPLDDKARYEIHIDNNGDAREDLTFQFDFRQRLSRNGLVQFQVGDKNVGSVLRNVGAITGTGSGNEDGLHLLESYKLKVISGDRQNGRKRSILDANTGEKFFRKPFDYSGTKTFSGPGNYDAYARQFIHDINIPNCPYQGKVFVGQRHEAFKISLGEVFDLVNFVPIDGDVSLGGGAPFPGGVKQDPERNTLARNNVTSLALEIHKDCINGGNNVIGAWTSASQRQVSILNPYPTFDFPHLTWGDWTQVSRLGMPLVNELVIAYDKKDLFNTSHPKNDGQFATFVTNPVLPEILNALFLSPVNQTLGTDFATLAPTNFPRQDLVTAFLTGFDGVNKPVGVQPSEMLRLNTTIAATPREQQHALGLAGGDLAGFPNGRRPGDDTVDIALRVVMGALCHDLPLGTAGAPVNLGLCSPEDAVVGFVPFTDGTPIDATEFNNSFPYLLTPYPGSPVGAPLPTPSD